jgi:predicted RNase H-like HicB family nuclease
MTAYTAICERAPDGNWSACTRTPIAAMGTGPTMEDALEDLKSAMTLWLEHVKELGQEIPTNSLEAVSVEMIVPYKPA